MSLDPKMENWANFLNFVFDLRYFTSLRLRKIVCLLAEVLFYEIHDTYSALINFKLVYLINLLLRTIQDTFRLEKGILRNKFQG